jgi:hypothetical protein
MNRYRYDYDHDEDGYADYDSAEYPIGDDEEESEEEQDTIPALDRPSGQQGVDVSMEIDEHGNEVWFAKDARIPGSSSMGHSVEEAIDGVEERRREYREMLRRSREKRRKRDAEDAEA